MSGDRCNGNKIGRYARRIWFTGVIIFAMLIYTGMLYYHSSDIIAYKFLRVRHCAPRDINGALKRMSFARNDVFKAYLLEQTFGCVV